MRIRIFILLGAIATSLLGQMPTAVGRRGMVVAGNEVAARFGLNILRRGGNAIDAAIATGFALAVIQPRAGNIGGGGFMVIRLADGATTTIDFREKAPQGATRDMYIGSDGNVIDGLSTVGALASGVPGTVRGYGLAHARYGKLPWAALLQESINLADRGFAITYQIHSDLARQADVLTQFAETASIFYPDGEAPRLNSLFRQPDLAATLRRISLAGADEFYTGRTAQLLADFMTRHGGLITLGDLANYQAVERPPVEFDYRDTHIITMPPPSAGGFVLAEILNQWEQIDIGDLGYHSAAHIHAMVEAYRRAFADRAKFAADPDFVDVPVGRLISDGHAATLWKSVSPAWASASADFGGNLISNRTEGGQTTHISVIDRQGNAVALTITLNSLYGSGMVVAGAGYFLNNEMDDFVSKPGAPNMYGLIGTEVNAIRPGKRMVSSMTPTIVTRNGQPLLITGSPGGATITTTVAQIISGIIDFGMSAPAAVAAPRIHHQWIPNIIQTEPWAVSAETQIRLQRMGHVLTEGGPMGAAHTIYIDPETGWYHGIADVRREADGAGY